MSDPSTAIAGIVIPSTSPLFLTVVAMHVLVALICVVTGFIAMLSPKRFGRHPRFGSIYYWHLSVVFATAIVLSVMRWEEDKTLFVLAVASFAAGTLGRAALRGRWPHWPRLHIAGMGASYIVLLIAFYVDNGKNLPVWRDLPAVSYWLIPLAVGTPIVIRALLSHPLVRLFP
jgi:hypothetical protein